MIRLDEVQFSELPLFFVLAENLGVQSRSLVVEHFVTAHVFVSEAFECPDSPLETL